MPQLNLILSTGRADAHASFGNGGPAAGPAAIMKAFAPLCARLAAETGGEAQIASSPAELGKLAKRRGRAPGIHLCFAAPPDIVDCPPWTTVPVFGWAMDSLPDGRSAETDWTGPLARLGRAICLSRNAADAVRAAMGEPFAVCAVTPLAGAGRNGPTDAPREATLNLPAGEALDTSRWTQHRPPLADFDHAQDLAEAEAASPGEEVLFRSPPPWRKTLRYRLGTTRLHARAWYGEALEDLVPPRVTRAAARAVRLAARGARRALAGRLEVSSGAHDTQGEPGDWLCSPISLSGTVFCAVHGMWDRSWSDAISAFVWHFREHEDATLFIRSARMDQGTRDALAGYLRRLLPFRCRVVLVAAELTAQDEQALIEATSFYVCASHAEASPLPLLHCLAAGRPAIAPRHSALCDIIGPDWAIPVASTPAPDYWPGDPREQLRATSHRLDWEDLGRAYAHAYQVAGQPEYAGLQAAAAARARSLDEAGEATLRAFLTETVAHLGEGVRAA